jgi:tetratricopeptide (TPR) repeat protein
MRQRLKPSFCQEGKHRTALHLRQMMPAPADYQETSAMGYRFNVAVMALFVGVALPGALLAQAPDAHHGERMPLFGERLGSYSWPVTTHVPKAQAYFDQGARLMYAYTRADARRSFQEALREDPSCAMCWWGEAWSLGSYLNGPMRAADAPAAFAAVQRAQELAASASPVERALIAALATRYAPDHPAGGRRGLDSAYVNAMAEVYDRFPHDVEVATLYADALMLLEPRRGVWPLEKPSVALILELLEGALARDIGHPGACHAYVHATETTPKVVDAQQCADLLGASIPGASHINHMPSHTYNRVGRWGDATRSNIEAVQTDRRAVAGDGFAIYPSHNLHMLLFSASMDGQGAIAAQAARDYAKMVASDGGAFRALVLVRFGRFDEVLELTRTPTHPVSEGLWAFARGLSQLRLGAADSARYYLARVDSLAEHTPATRTLRMHEPARLLGIVGGILRGEMARADARIDDAVAAFQHAIALEDGLEYDEPEPLPFMTRDFLGALLLETNRAAAAEQVYQAALVARPHNGWSLVGLEQALRAQGRAEEAELARGRFTATWSRSEVWLPTSRF